MSSPRDKDVKSPTIWYPQLSEYLEGKWKIGYDIDQKPSRYVTVDILKRYWKKTTVSNILNTGYYEPITISPDAIIESFIRVWSTLVWIGRPECITWFRRNARDDEYFFVNGFTETVDADPRVQEMLQAFRNHWWRFWPVRFQSAKMHQRELDQQRVLPITSVHRLSPPNSFIKTIIYEIQLDPLCCEFSNVST